MMERKDVVNVLNLIKDSYYDAIDRNIVNENEGRQNGDRSTEFIKSITTKLEEYFNLMNYGKNIHVFSKTSPPFKPFKLSEFLFDIHVCKLASVQAPAKKTDVTYVVKSLIQMESELEKNTSQIVKDFNKLVCGSGCLKVMIISKSDMFDGKIRKILSKVAENIEGEVYLVVIEHPGEWDYAKGRDNYSKVYSYDINDKEFKSDLDIE